MNIFITTTQLINRDITPFPRCPRCNDGLVITLSDVNGNADGHCANPHCTWTFTRRLVKGIDR